MTSIFARIVKGEVPCERVYEDERHLAFLDIKPVRPGHTLVIPKKEVEYLFHMPSEAYDALWRTVRYVEEGVRMATGCRRVCVAVVGYEVPHVHVHLIPTNRIEDFPFPPRPPAPPDDLPEMARRIREALGA